MRLQNYLSLLLAAALFINALWAHDIHISRCQSAVSGQVFGGKLTFFKDDFMAALAKWHGKSLDGLPDTAFDRLKAAYLATHFSVIVNENTALKLALTDHGEDKQSIWFHFKFESQTEITALKIGQSALFEPFPDQVNIMHVHASGQEYHHVFSAASREWHVQF